MSNNEIQIQIPDVGRLMAQPDEAFAQLANNVLGQYEMTRNRSAFNMSAYKDDGTLRQFIITPLNDKSMTLLYTEDEQYLVAAGLRVRSEFEKNKKVGTGARENFLIELTKDVLRNYKGLPHDSEDYQRLSRQVMDHVTSQMPSAASLIAPAYSNVTYKFAPPKGPGA